MRTLIIPILFIAQICFSQTKIDYEIYSMLIDNQIQDGKFDNDNSRVIAITNKLTTFSSRVDFKDYADVFFGNDKQIAYMTANYQDSIYVLIDNPEFKELFQRFSENYNNQQNFESEKFSSRHLVEIIDKKWIEDIFDYSEKVNYKKAWKKYYKEYPNSPGYFEISKIEYLDNFGLVYFVYRTKPLIGSGKIIFLKKVNNKWIKYDSLTIWND